MGLQLISPSWRKFSKLKQFFILAHMVRLNHAREAANNPSEATIAKRRSYANTISYLTPPAENAGLYKGLKQLSELISSYQSLKDTGRGPQIRDLVVGKVHSKIMEKPKGVANWKEHSRSRPTSHSDSSSNAEYRNTTTANAQVRTLAETVRLDAPTRLLNPKWYEGMMSSGYEGVREIEKRRIHLGSWFRPSWKPMDVGTGKLHRRTSRS
ncbi:hypothetical protein OIU85_000430 [Salix viminalis]|uniref:CobN/magnesium chelatase domain-containing protein n=1 Tax=Salix viminalis TaxID=40686 RepID=A0A9Q0VK92_SALVM|nr:hypothetical protein OIU85_000430 [Salix viminalis]